MVVDTSGIDVLVPHRIHGRQQVAGRLHRVGGKTVPGTIQNQTLKKHVSRVGWEPFRTVLLIMLDSGLRPGEIFRMRWENIHWEHGVIFNPRGKSRKSKRYVPLTERMKAALLRRKGNIEEGWVFQSKRSKSGHITDREVSKQWLEAKKLAAIPESGEGRRSREAAPREHRY